MTIETRIKKLEGIMPTKKDPFDKLSNFELLALEKKLQLSLHKTIRDRQEAEEYKGLFIENPDILELLDPKTPTSKEAIPLLERQMKWELKHERSAEERDRIIDYYEGAIKAYKFFRSV